MGKPHEGPIQTTKTQARAGASTVAEKLRRNGLEKKLDVQRFFI